MKYRVWHRTVYKYSDVVEDSVNLVNITPRQLPWQQVSGHELSISPATEDRSESIDYFGNEVSYFHLSEKHGELAIESSALVDVHTPIYDADACAQPWELSRPLVHPDAPGAWEAAEFAIESAGAAHSPAVFQYAAASLTPGRGIADAITDLVARIFTDFTYDPTATTVTSTVADVFKKRAGVCQDFAHLAIACLRSHGLAARYVSGYLATEPPPGKERVFGADASHAWLAVWLAASGEWLAVDPTNNQWANDRYVTSAWGRDYGDVRPVQGVIVTEAKKSTLRVSVDVAPVGA